MARPIEVELKFEGLFLEKSLPLLKEKYNCQGIYTVYTGIYFEKENRSELRKLLYIGETKNLSERMHEHIKNQDWKEYFKDNEVFIFAVAKLDETLTEEDRQQIEAALIYHHCKLPCNDKHTKSFGKPLTRILTSGYNDFLEKDFSAHGDWSFTPLDPLAPQ